MEGNSDNDGGRINLTNLAPVPPEQSGEGLPYAPENFPNPGDIWRWKAGKRISSNGNYRDRYLYLPRRLAASYRGGGFPSKLAAERYVKESFPRVNIADFFASFSWSIPSGLPGNMNPVADGGLRQLELKQQPESDFDIGGCKAGNKTCSSLILEEEKENSSVTPCDICCVEPKFCRECCCILCYKTVDSAYGGYSYIMCKVKLGNNICGHVCHLECALRSYSAGTVGGTIGLDAEYFCWRCDGRTELISHANKLLQTCEAIETDGADIKEKILTLGICLLRGSEKVAAKELLSLIALASLKLKHGTNTEDSLKADDNFAATSSDDEGPLKNFNVQKGTKSFHYQSELLKLDAEFDKTMEDLEKSHKYEYKLAEERLHTHKKYLLNISQQLDKEKSELASETNSSRSSVLLQTVEKRNEQLRQELKKFEEMKKVANGFGSTSKESLEKHFGL
ncbi:OBERON-like protein isoform X2 [Vicia villosa]|uniref:OBERON-like protein isoform X2 n=1 Tax=Vicia villosa TaxID=3911 RepID=UPI00273BF92A|nr:OBERON-like protein isoform X2 [Vicia villosa]